MNDPIPHVPTIDPGRYRELLEAVAESQRVTPETAKHILWHRGDQNLGVQPGGFENALILAIIRADEPNRERLRKVYPAHVAAWEQTTSEAGFDRLRLFVMEQSA